MLTDQLLETIQADRNRQIQEADRVRMLTPPEADPVDLAAATPPRPEHVATVSGPTMRRQVRPAADGSR